MAYGGGNEMDVMVKKNFLKLQLLTNIISYISKCNINLNINNLLF